MLPNKPRGVPRVDGRRVQNGIFWVLRSGPLWRDLPERTPDALLADKGYDADAIRADLAERKIEAVIPGRSNRRAKIEHDRALYKQRNRIERMFGDVKINRGIATRYDQLANSFLVMVHLAAARYWLKFVHAA